MPDPIKIPGNIFLMINQQIFPITKPVTSIGRLLENDIVINNNFISRYHAQIVYDDNRFWIQDLKSTSGTFLNNKKIQKAALFSGDMILCAATLIIFVSESGPLESASDEETGDIAKRKDE